MGRISSLTGNSNIAISREINSRYDEVKIVADNIISVVTTAGMQVQIDSLVTYKPTLDSVLAIKPEIDSILADKVMLDSLFSDKEKLDSLFTDKATLDSLYAQKATLDRLFISIGNIDTTAIDIENIDNVAYSIDNVNTTGNNISGVNTTATNINDVKTIAINISDVNTTATNMNAINTTASISSDISTTANKASDISKVSSISNDVTEVSSVSENVTTVAGISTDVSTVASISAKVTTTAANDANITTVANSISNINAVKNDITNVDAVATNIDNINSVKTSITDVNTVATDINAVKAVSSDLTNVDAVNANKVNIDTVASNKTNVDTVATNIDNVSTTAESITNVNTTAASIVDIGTVAEISSDVSTAASKALDISTVAGISTDVTTVSGISTNVTTTANISADIQTVANKSSDITVVADNNSNITTVATDIVNIDNVATNLAKGANSEILNAEANANTASQKATEASDSAASASADAAQTAQNRVATAADRVQTGNDVASTNNAKTSAETAQELSESARDAASVAATNASNASKSSLSAANFKGKYSDLSGALSIPASVSLNGDGWMLEKNLSDVTQSVPSTDNSDWMLITKGTTTINTVKKLQSLSNPISKVWVSGYHTKGDGAFGSNILEWDETSTEAHNGGTVFNPNAPFPTDWSDATQVDAWYNFSDTGAGRYKLRFSGDVNVRLFGAVGDDSNEITQIQSAVAYCVSTKQNLKFDKQKTYRMVLTSENTIGFSLDWGIKIDFNGSIVNIEADSSALNIVPVQAFRIYDQTDGNVGTYELVNGVINAPKNYDELTPPTAFPKYNEMKDPASGYSYATGILYPISGVNLKTDNLDILGYWNSSITGSGGDVGNNKGSSITKTTTITNSRMEALGTPVNGASRDGNNMEIFIDRCYLQGNFNQGPDWLGHGRIFYVTPQASFKITNTIMIGGGRSPIKHMETSVNEMYGFKTDIYEMPKFAICENVTFINCDERKALNTYPGAAINTDLNLRTYFIDCVFDGFTGVNSRSGVTLDRCVAKNGGSLLIPYTVPRYTDKDTNTHIIESCSSDESLGTYPSINTRPYGSLDYNKKLNIKVNNSSFNNGTEIVLAGNGNITINNSSFNSLDFDNSSYIYLANSRGTFSINNCDVNGITSGFIKGKKSRANGVINNLTDNTTGAFSITFSEIPKNGETITIDNTTFTFKDTIVDDHGGNYSEVQIYSTLEKTLQAFVGKAGHKVMLDAGTTDIVPVISLNKGGNIVYVGIDDSSYVITTTTTATVSTYIHSSFMDGVTMLDNGEITGAGNKIKQDTSGYLNPDEFFELELPNRIFNETITTSQFLFLQQMHSKFFIDGTSDTKYIRIGSQGYSMSNLFVGSIVTIMVQGTFKLLDTGNIIPKHTNARTVGEKIELVIMLDTASNSVKFKEI